MEKTSSAQSPPQVSVAAAPVEHRVSGEQPAHGDKLFQVSQVTWVYGLPLPEVVLHLLSGAEVVLPVSLF